MRAMTVTICLAMLAAASPPAASQQLPPLPETEIIRQLTSDNPEEWLSGVGQGLGVPPNDRSHALLTAMIEALDREVEWHQQQTGPWHPSFDDTGEGFGESSAILARELAATGDARILPALAWHAYNAGPVAHTLFAFGHEALPHLLGVAVSPRATPGVVRPALEILASIVWAHSPGGYSTQLAEAAHLHLYGPPDHYRSSWSNPGLVGSVPQAIGLASIIRTPELLDRLEVLAAMSPEEVELARWAHQGDVVLDCARGALDESEVLNLLFCDPTWWARQAPPA